MLRRAFLHDQSGAGAAEFALVLPIMMIFMFGIIDAGRFAWELNQIGKAVQIGARRAVVTDTIPIGLRTYSYAVNGGATQGTAIPQASFSGIYCTGTASTATCNWKGATPTNWTDNATSPEAFKALADRMMQFDPRIGYSNVRIDYDWSGLGFAGDPNGPDVAPLTKVTVTGLTYRPLTTFLFPSVGIPFPDISYSLTMEDGSGSVSS